jgi:hypothetical protein
LNCLAVLARSLKIAIVGPRSGQCLIDTGSVTAFSL